MHCRQLVLKREKEAEAAARLATRDDPERHSNRTELLADKYCKRVVNWISADESAKSRVANNHTTVYDVEFRRRDRAAELGAMRMAPNEYVPERQRVDDALREQRFVKQMMYETPKGLFRPEHKSSWMGPPMRLRYESQAERVAAEVKRNALLSAIPNPIRPYDGRPVDPRTFKGARVFQSTCRGSLVDDLPTSGHPYVHMSAPTNDATSPVLYNPAGAPKIVKRDTSGDVSSESFLPMATMPSRWFFEGERVNSYEWHGAKIPKGEPKTFFASAKEISQASEYGNVPTQIASMGEDNYLKERARMVYEHRFSISDRPRAKFSASGH